MMSSVELPPSDESLTNPYTAPTASPERLWRLDGTANLHGTPAESLLLAGHEAESMLRAIGLVAYVLGVYWLLGVLGFLVLVVQMLGRWISAPWVGQPYQALVLGLLPATASAASVALGFGLRRLRPWSKEAGIVLVLVLGTYIFMIAAKAIREEGDPTAAAFAITYGSIFLIPVAIALGPRAARVLADDYRRAVAETPYIRVRAHLPAALVAAWVLAVAMTIGLYVLAASRQ